MTMKITFVDNWNDFWKWYSTWAMTALALVEVGWQTVPPEVLTAMPDGARAWVVGILWALGMLGRVVKQGPTE
jgi:hypothetical protein